MTEEQKLEYRNRIIEELWHKRTVHGISKKVGAQMFVGVDAQLDEDVTQEVFLKLMKMPVDRLIALYQENNRHLNNYIGRIVVNDGYNIQDDKPYGSLAAKLFHTSNLKYNLTLSPTEESGGEDESDTLRNVLVAEEEEPNIYGELWEKIEQHLTPEELDFIQLNLKPKKYGVKRPKKQLTMYSQLKKKIYSIGMVIAGKELTKQQEKDMNFQLGKWEVKQKVEKPPPKKVKGESHRKKAVNQYTLDKKYITTYPSARDAADALGCSSNSIAQCCLGNARTSMGYIWKYATKKVDIE